MVDRGLLPRFEPEPPKETLLYDFERVHPGAAVGMVYHSDDLEELVNSGVNPENVILAVNGEMPYDRKEFYSKIAGAIFLDEKTAAQNTHFAIELKTLGIPAGFRKGKVENGQFVFRNGDGERIAIDKGEYVSMDATNGNMYRGQNTVVELDALRYVRNSEEFEQAPESYLEFNDSLQKILARLARDRGLNVDVGVNVYTPEQLRMSMRVNPRSYVNLVRTENALLVDPDRRTFQTMFSLIYARGLLADPDSALSEELGQGVAAAYGKAIDGCMPTLLKRFRDQQRAHVVEMFDEFYQQVKSVRGGRAPSKPYPMQVRFLDASVNEMFTRGGADFRNFMYDKAHKDERAAFFDEIGQRKLEKRIKPEMFDVTFETLKNSMDYLTDLRGVRMMKKAPEIYRAQAEAFVDALDEVVRQHEDFYKCVDPVFFIPYVQSPVEVQRVEEVMEGAKESTGKDVEYKLGTLLELHQAARYMSTYLSQGVRHFMIGSNDLIANWRGLQRTEGFHFGNKVEDEAVVDNFHDYLRTIHNGIEEYQKQAGLTATALREEMYVSLAGELPARILEGVLSGEYAHRIDAIGLPPLKIPHVARKLYDHEERILDNRRAGRR